MQVEEKGAVLSMLSLPNEVLMELTSYCGQKTIFALSLTCKSLRRSFQSYMDQNIVVKSGSQMCQVIRAACEGVTAEDGTLFGSHGYPQRRSGKQGVVSRGSKGKISASRARFARVHSLTIKATPIDEADKKYEQDLDLAKLAKAWIRTTKCMEDCAEYIDEPLPFTLALLTNLTSLRIYDADTDFCEDTVDCLTAWAPGLKVFHLYQRMMDSITLEKLLRQCPTLEEVEVSGLTFGEEANDMLHLMTNDQDLLDEEESAIEQYETKRESLARQMIQHPNLRHFASDRSSMDVQIISPHGALLERLSEAMDEGEASSDGTWKLQSLELHDNDRESLMLLDFLSSRASAKLERLSLYMIDTVPEDEDVFQPEWLEYCNEQYDYPCFFQATTDLDLSCSRDMFPLVFFERVGHRITALHIDNSFIDQEEDDGLGHNRDVILSALRSGLLPRLTRLTVTGSEHDTKYTDAIHAAVVTKQKPSIYFCSDDRDAEARERYKRQRGWDQNMSDILQSASLFQDDFDYGYDSDDDYGRYTRYDFGGDADDMYF